jgi:hypothetical protein
MTVLLPFPETSEGEYTMLVHAWNFAVPLLIKKVDTLTDNAEVLQRLHDHEIFRLGHFYKIETDEQFESIIANAQEAKKIRDILATRWHIRIGDVLDTKLRERFEEAAGNLAEAIPDQDAATLLIRLQTPLVDVLKPRYAHSLADEGVEYLGQLVIMHWSDVKAIDHVGKGGATAIERVLQERYDFRLGMKLPKAVLHRMELFASLGSIDE